MNLSDTISDTTLKVTFELHYLCTIEHFVILKVHVFISFLQVAIMATAASGIIGWPFAAVIG